MSDAHEIPRPVRDVVTTTLRIRAHGLTARVPWDMERPSVVADAERRFDREGPAGRAVVVAGTRHTHMDVRMLAYCGGRERSLRALTGLVSEVGLELRSHSSGSDTRSIIELAPGSTAKR